MSTLGGRNAFDLSCEGVGNEVNVLSDVLDFHKKFGVTYDGKPRSLDERLSKFRKKFLLEEFNEYVLSVDSLEDAVLEKQDDLVREHLADALDALVDLVYVAVGTAYLHGFDFAEAWRRVQAANMAKVRAASAADSKRGHASDVVKPPGWTAPDHSDLVLDHAHREEA